MTSNNSRHKNQIHNYNTMISRIHFPFHNWWTNWDLPIKFISRYYTTRHILRSSTLPLRTKNGCSICNLCSNKPLIPSNDRINTPPTMSKSPILPNVHWCKSDILPSTLPRPIWYTTTILRLPRYNNAMKRSIIYWFNYCIRSTSSIHLHYLRSTSSSTTSNLNIPHAIINGMKRYASSKIPQSRRNYSDYISL